MPRPRKQHPTVTAKRAPSVAIPDTPIRPQTTNPSTQDALRSQSILDSLPAHVAVIGPDGTIIETNDAWNCFARENGNVRLRAVGPGANYLDECRRAVQDGIGEAKKALSSIELVLANHEPSGELEYTCDSTAGQRWFVMTVSPLKGPTGGAVVSHTDITWRKLAEIGIQKGEAAIRALVEGSILSVVVEDDQGRIVLVNRHAEEVFGYDHGELIGQPLTILIPENSRRRHTRLEKDFFEARLHRHMGMGLTLEGRRKDGSVFPAEIGLSTIESTHGKLVAAFVSDITARRHLEQIAQERAEQVQALAARLLTAQEEERRRVSRELHDQICQQLASLAIDISGYAATPPPPQDERLSRIKDLYARVVKVSEATRHIAYQLHPSMLDDLGLVASLRAMCREFSQHEGIDAVFEDGAIPSGIPREVASCLYRVAQEGLQNIAKHSRARHARLNLGLQKRALVLSICDDGTGFDPGIVRGRGGLGLIGMQERAHLVGGRLTIAGQNSTAGNGRRKPATGTRITLEVPVSGGLS